MSASVRPKTWVEPPAIDPAATAKLAAALGVHEILARILIHRGKSDVEDSRRFLEPQADTLASPHELLGAEAAIERIKHATESGQRILIFGDFDVDGVTGTSLALNTLRSFATDVDFLLPRRLVHGYGLSMNVLPEVIERRPDLVITVDCGIRSVEEVQALREAGIDTVITDHHEVGPEMPDAVAVVDPKQPGCPYPDKRLAAVGVMYQLMRGYVLELEHELDLDADLDLVALGTVADVVPLEGENRVLTAEGLKVINRHGKIGMMALAHAAGIEARLDSWHLAYLLAPRINAAGRLGDAAVGVRLMTATETSEAARLARELDEQNQRRQRISADTLTEALQAIDRGVAGTDPAGIVLASDRWHPGVIGIACAKLVERFHRPSVLIAMNGNVGRGSVRSIPGVDVCEVLAGCADLLVQYGGHEMAAGLTIERDRIPELREKFARGVEARLTPENSVPQLAIDCEIASENIDLELASELDRLGPFGYGNVRPVFLVRGATPVSAPRTVGRGHLKLRLRRQGAPALDCIGFDLAERAADGFPPGKIDVVGHVAVNEWNGRRVPQLQILDFREAQS
jgi:single-stranded-DNA-specific exonuclease